MIALPREEVRSWPSGTTPGRRLPVKLDATSNGEYAPIPLEPVHREAKHVAMELAKIFVRNALRVYPVPDEVLRACLARPVLQVR